VRVASPSTLGAVFAVVKSDALDSNAHHGHIAVALADSAKGDNGILAAASGGGVSVVIDVNGSASYPLTLSIEWECAAEESDVINTSLGHVRVSPVDTCENAQDLAVNRTVVSQRKVSPHPHF